MEFNNTGAYRHQILSVQRFLENDLVGVEMLYDIKESFRDPGTGLYLIPLTEQELSQLSEDVYQSRLTAFIAYVYGLPELSGYVNNITIENPAFGPNSEAVGLTCIVRPPDEIPPVEQLPEGPGEA